MDFMKVIDQTVREIKREVNLKVLKVPEIEQKVLDATDDEPWGPHGTALSEIAQATKKFSECQMVMNVLWTRLTETDRNWRHVYKALAVIEYLVANGSERAVDDIIEHTFQISALSCFEYVEPSGKDSGINVRKKVETIVSLLNDKDKIQAARNKAAATRDKYVGLSSTGVTFKSGSAAALSSSGFQKSDRYGGFGGETFKDSEDRFEPGKYRPRRDVTASSKKPSPRYGSTIQDSSSSGASKPSIKSVVDNFSSIRSSAPSNGNDDDFDDFDPRGTSNTKEAVGVKMDLFGDSLIGDVWDGNNAKAEEEVDLFGDAAFVSAPPPPPQSKVDDDVFGVASSPAVLDLFSEPLGIKHSKSTSNIVDPFGMTDDLFGSFSSSMDKSKTETPAAPPPFNKDAPFQVKSGVWADSLSRGLIDLNISGPKKKVDLTDVGIVGGLSSDKGGRPMNKSTATASSSTDLDDFFSFGGSFHN